MMEIEKVPAERASTIRARVEHHEELEFEGQYDLSGAIHILFQAPVPDWAHSIVADIPEEELEVYESQFHEKSYIISVRKEY